MWRFAVILIFISSSLIGQNSQTEKYIEDLIESLNEDAESFDLNTTLQDLRYYSLYPLNINTASRNQLEKLYVLGDYQILSLLKYREEYGDVISIQELVYINGFTEQLVILILPFITVVEGETPKADYKKVFSYTNHEVVTRFQRTLPISRGYQADSNGEKKYNGNAWKYYLRYDFDASNTLFAGYVGEKDPGEVFLKQNNNHGFDFNSAHVMLKGRRWLQSAIIGDYHIETGQGLLYWSGYTGGKSRTTQQMLKRPQYVRRNMSINEIGYLRGVATNLKFNSISISSFLNYKKTDATLNDEGISSLYTAGLHRTDNEIKKKSNVTEKSFGGSLRYNGNKLMLGLNGFYTIFERPLAPDDDMYLLFYPEGKEFLGTSVDYRYLSSKLQIYGEAAYNGKTFANIHNFNFNLSHSTSLLFQYRNFAKDYYMPYSNAVRENTNTINEEAFLLGFESNLGSKFYTKALADVFAFEWLRYSTGAPSKGEELQLELGYNQENMQSYILYRNKSKAENLSKDNTFGVIRQIENQNKQSLRVHSNYTISESLIGKSRLELSQFKGDTNGAYNGILVYQDFDFQPKSLSMKITGRIAYHHISNYDARIYAYERNARYVFSTPVYYGVGWKYYLLIDYKPFSFMRTYLRWSQNVFTDRETIGSGNDKIAGRTKSEVLLQVVLNF